jgi:hypothetical protein
MSFLIRDRNRTKPSFIITFTSLYHEAHNNQNVNKNYTTMNLARPMEGLMTLGSSDGKTLGSSDGMNERSTDGNKLGSSDGNTDCSSNGQTLGSFDGRRTKGSSDGSNNGLSNGKTLSSAFDGRTVSLREMSRLFAHLMVRHLARLRMEGVD